MTPEEIEAQKKEEKTSNSQASGEEKTTENQEEDTSQNNEDSKEEDQVVLTKEEHAKLTKKATDFDGMIEKQRLAKLAKGQESQNKNNEEETKLDPVEMRRVANEVFQENNKDTYQENLKEAYADFKKNNAWADDETIFSQITEKFDPGSSINKGSLLSRLNQAAEQSFPDQFMKAKVDKATANALIEKEKIDNAGGAGGAGTENSKSGEERTPLSPEVKRYYDSMKIKHDGYGIIDSAKNKSAG